MPGIVLISRIQQRPDASTRRSVRLIALTPQGQVLELLDDGDPEASRNLVQKMAAEMKRLHAEIQTEGAQSGNPTARQGKKKPQKR